jgi:hypothetical protein
MIEYQLGLDFVLIAIAASAFYLGWQRYVA